jgi:hypothetical protein
MAAAPAKGLILPLNLDCGGSDGSPADGVSRHGTFPIFPRLGKRPMPMAYAF